MDVIIGFYRLTVKNPQFELNESSVYGPTFADDIHICNESNAKIGSYTHFGYSYNLPNGYTKGGNARDYLAGNYGEWTTTEIEVYQTI